MLKSCVLVRWDRQRNAFRADVIGPNGECNGQTTRGVFPISCVRQLAEKVPGYYKVYHGSDYQIGTVSSMLSANNGD